MVSSLLKTIVIATGLATVVHADSDLKLCKLPNYNLQKAAKAFPELTKAINTVLDQGVATWYTDRISEAERQDFLKSIKACKSDETALISVYGLPQKDCADGYSSEGGNRDSAMYKQWVTDLAKAVGDQKVIYIYEADALALTIDGKCGTKEGYLENIRTGLPILAKNPNAKIYLDVGYWTLQWPALITQIIANFKKVETAAKIHGIAIGTSNYRPISEMVGLCSNFSREYGSSKYNCVFDTSRDFSETVPGTDWCNQMWAGVGHPSTGKTNYKNVDAFLWVKPVGESDGTCNGGPKAGQFWYDGFIKWWNQGWFVKKEGQSPLVAKPHSSNAGSWSDDRTTSPPSPTLTPSKTTKPKTKKPKTTKPAVTTAKPKPKTTAPPKTPAATTKKPKKCTRRIRV